jgi:hypothetical protein
VYNNGTDVGEQISFLSSLTLLTALPTASGGTGLTSFTANGVAYASSTSALATGSALTFNGTNLATTGSVTSAGASNSGNLTFTGTGNRITGDFSNLTLANRVTFQTSTVNDETIVQAAPNGAGTFASFDCLNSSDIANASALSMGVFGTTETRLVSARRGTGGFLPMTFYVGGDARIRIDTSGNVGIGTNSPGARLQINTDSGAADMRLSVGGTVYANIYASSSDTNLFSVAATPLVFGTNNTERVRIDASGNLLLGGVATPGAKVMYIANATTVPASNPSGGGVLYVEGGALKYRGSSGTVTTIANA